MKIKINEPTICPKDLKDNLTNIVNRLVNLIDIATELRIALEIYKTTDDIDDYEIGTMSYIDKQNQTVTDFIITITNNHHSSSYIITKVHKKC